MKPLLPFVVFAVLLLAVSVHAQVYFFDDFEGASVNTNLYNGTTGFAITTTSPINGTQSLVVGNTGTAGYVGTLIPNATLPTAYNVTLYMRGSSATAGDGYAGVCEWWGSQRTQNDECFAVGNGHGVGEASTKNTNLAYLWDFTQPGSLALTSIHRVRLEKTSTTGVIVVDSTTFGTQTQTIAGTKLINSNTNGYNFTIDNICIWTATGNGEGDCANNAVPTPQFAVNLSLYDINISSLITNFTVNTNGVPYTTTNGTIILMINNGSNRTFLFTSDTLNAVSIINYTVTGNVSLQANSTEFTVNLLNGLFFRYSFDKGFNDSTSNNYNLHNQTSNTSLMPYINATDVKVGNGSATFIGAASLSSNGLLYDTVIIPDNRTISAWVKTRGTSNDAYYNSIMVMGNEPGVTRFWSVTLYSTKNNLTVFEGNSSGSDKGWCGGSITNNTWHHIAVRQHGIDLPDMYVDGVLQNLSVCISLGNQTEPYLNPVGTNASIEVGSEGGYYTMNGSIDELNVWNRMLNVPEIRAMYNNGNGYSNNDSLLPFAFSYTQPGNDTYTYNVTPSFNFSGTVYVGPANVTLFINGTKYGTNYTYNSMTLNTMVANASLPAGAEYLWWFNASVNGTSVLSDQRKIYVTGGGSSTTLACLVVSNGCSVTSSNGCNYIQ